VFPTPDQFVEIAFPDISFGDKRLVKRFGNVARALLSHPEEALPDKFLSPKDYFAALDFLNHPAVTHDHFLSTHQVALLNRLEDAGPAVVLFLHDTTDLDFSGHKTLAADTGQIGNGGGRGWLCHNSLAVDPDSRLIFGLAHQILHVRPAVGKGEPVALKRDRADRESRLWLRAIDAIGPAPEDKLWVHVADRGADIFELLQALHDRRRHYVIRSSHNRALVLQPGEGSGLRLAAGDAADAADAAEPATPPPAAAPHLLHDRLRTLPGCATWAVTVGATSKRQGRVAMVQASYCCVELRPPHVRKGDYRREAVAVWAVRVWEVSPPAGEEPLEWFLLTDQPIRDGGSLRRVVGWYECRPVIEEYHKGQKSGVGIEKLQLQDAQSVQAAIALMSVVAVAMVNLRGAARDAQQADRPAEEIVPRLWVRVLSIWRYKGLRPLTVREFTLALARLGGHLNRKSDGLPGWITLWRGWERLHTMLDYELSRETCPEL
jgi:hypothetical protein